MKSIDVIIPSYRLESKYLLAITQMKKPKGVEVRYLIIADNPDVEVPLEIQKIVDNENILLFINKKNLGAHGSRNVGLENSNAEWILFIDDDVIPETTLLDSYKDASIRKPDAIGFFGETLFPTPFNRFTKGIIACDILTFFFIAGYYDKLKWAPTANVIIKNNAVDNLRFKNIFPNNGGGEDIDFFLQIHRSTQKELLCLDNAKVYHDWWYKGKRNYTRFIRWSYGDTLLHQIFPEYTYYNFPNVIESTLLSFIVGLIALSLVSSPLLLVSMIGGVWIGEVFIEFLRLLIYKGLYQGQFVFESVLIKASNDLGRLYMQLWKLKRVRGLFERFDHFCDGKHIKYQKIWAGIKFLAYLLFSALIYSFFM